MKIERKSRDEPRTLLHRGCRVRMGYVEKEFHHFDQEAVGTEVSGNM